MVCDSIELLSRYVHSQHCISIESVLSAVAGPLLEVKLSLG